jgi:preprotein translocase subunit SecE
VVLTTLLIMIGLIFVLNLGFGKLITLLFSK